jgi:hypothetical protein
LSQQVFAPEASHAPVVFQSLKTLGRCSRTHLTLAISHPERHLFGFYILDGWKDPSTTSLAESSSFSVHPSHPGGACQEGSDFKHISLVNPAVS